MIYNPRSLNLRLSIGGRHFRWTVAVDGDLLVGGRPVLLGRRRAAPKLITFRFGDPIATAAAVILVLVIHVAEAEGDRRPDHQGELPFWQRTAAGHATRGGHNVLRPGIIIRAWTRSRCDTGTTMQTTANLSPT